MLIALNIIFAVVVLVGIVGLMLHAIRHEHRERTQVAGALQAKAAATRRSHEHRVASGAAAHRVNRGLSASRG